MGFQQLPGAQGVRPKVVSHYLLEKMRLADVTRAFIVIREGKWDIPAYFGDGAMLDMHLAYLVRRLPYGAPYTLDTAYPFVRHAVVAFGFPDILFRPDDGFVRLLDCQAGTKAEVVLGVFPAAQPDTMDMVDMDNEGRVRDIVRRPRDTRLRYAWIFAVWTPVFTRFQHEFLKAFDGGASDRAGRASRRRRPPGGHPGGIPTRAVTFPDPSYLDIGTPPALAAAIRDAGEALGFELTAPVAASSAGGGRGR